MADREIDIPIVGGLDQDTDARLTAKLVAVKNRVYTREGSLATRNGYTCLAPYNRRPDESEPPVCEHLAIRDQELVRIGDGAIDVCELTSIPVGDWMKKDELTRYCLYRRNITAGNISMDHDVAVSAANVIDWVNQEVFICVSLQQQSDASGTTTYSIVADVINTTTGTSILSSYRIASSSSDILCAPKVVTLDSGVYTVVTWYNATTGALYGSLWDMATMSFGAATSLVSSLRTGFVAILPSACYDICATNSDTFTVITELAAGTNRIRIQRFGANLGLVGTYTPSVTETEISAFALTAPDSSGIVYAAWTYEVLSGTYSQTIKVAGATWAGSYSENFTPQSLWTNNSGAGSAPIGRLGACVLSSTRGLVTWSQFSATTIDDEADYPRTAITSYWQEFTRATGIAVYDDARILDAFVFCSRPKYVGDRAYIYGTNVHSTHSTGFLVQLPVMDNVSEFVTPRIAGVTLPRICFFSYITQEFSCLTNIVQTRRGDRYFMAAYQLGGSAAAFIADNWGGALIQMTSGAEVSENVGGSPGAFGAVVSSTETNGLLLLGGGVPSAYDGDQTFELGFAYEPDVPSLISSSNGSGSLTGGGIYKYLFTYAWVDAQGNFHESAPSPITDNSAITLGASDDTVTLNLRGLKLTNRTFDGQTYRGIYIRIYRTVAGGATYYYVGSVLNNQTLTSVSQYTDTTSDTDLRLRPQIYSIGASNQQLVNRILPSCRYVTAYKGSVVYAGSDDDTIWFSKPMVPGFAPGFNALMSQDPFPGGRVTAIIGLDDVLYPFKATSIYAIAGDPPADNGSSTLSLPQKVPSQAGTVNHRSLLSIPTGILYEAKDGIYLLSRAQGNNFIGQGIATSLVSTDPPYTDGLMVASATLVPEKHVVRLVLDMGNRIFNLDLRRSNERGAVWTEDEVYDVVGDFEDEDVEVVAGCYWANAPPDTQEAIATPRYIWIGSNGRLYGENTIFQDVVFSRAGSELSTAYGIPTSVTLSVVKLAGLQGYTRCRAVAVLFEATGLVNPTVELDTDYKGTFDQYRNWESAEVTDMIAAHKTQLKVHPHPQKCQSFQVRLSTDRFEEIIPDSLTDMYGALTLTGISATVDINRGLNRMNPRSVR